MSLRKTAVIGGGPAGLMAAETLARAGAVVTIYDRMPNPGRKFLLAGRGGLNLTHSEPLPVFLDRYGPQREHMRGAIEAFPPAALRAWCEELGEPTFVGSSGRVFPASLKASPLLRAWLRRLEGLGVRLESGWRWTGWSADGALSFVTRAGEARAVAADATVLALGGASWPKLGGDGSWVPLLREKDVQVTPLTAANCGVRIDWTPLFSGKFAGQPLKRLVAHAGGLESHGEATVTPRGLEGGLIYPLVPALRNELARGEAMLTLDLRPDLRLDQLSERLAKPHGKQSLANHLRKAAGLPPVATSLLREGPDAALPADPHALAGRIKALRLRVTGLEPIERAISTAGGIAFAELDGRFMLRNLPGVFAAGEMLDWEAPTGGYLLQACFSTGRAAAEGVLAYLA